MITRNRLLGIMVLLAGLTAGYFASRGANALHERLLSNLPVFYNEQDIPDPSTTNLSTIYVHSKEHFKEVLIQGSNAIREAARRRNLLIQARDRVTDNHAAYEHLILQSERTVDLLRLQDYYGQFYMHYYRWLDSGDAQSAVQYKLSLGQFKATLDYVMEKHQEDPALSPGEVEELRLAIRIVEQSNRTMRWARVVVVVLLFLLLMGIPGLIRDNGYKRFAATLYFDSVFRPNLISDLNRWHSMQRMAPALLLLYLFSLVICSSFISWKIPLLFGALGLIPVIVLTAMSDKKQKLSALLISFMSPMMLVLILVIGIVAVRGPNFFWYQIWGAEVFRGLFFSLLFMLIFRKLHVYMILVRKWSNRTKSASAAMVWGAFGMQILLAGTLFYWFGPKESMVALNGEVLFLPEEFLGSPATLLSILMIITGIVTAGALLVYFLNRKREHESPRSA
ncbi:MAG: hypothetical protein DRI97_17320 [Bacteroidetes bacterium]|nr:MAG: hypothetical protein DRI97_17320 [Bacteroidota bacterium]